MTEFKVCSKPFFSNYIFNPFSKDLTGCQKAGAFFASFFIGLASFGLCHAIAAIVYRNKKFSVIPKDLAKEQKPQNVYKEKITDHIPGKKTSPFDLPPPKESKTKQLSEEPEPHKEPVEDPLTLQIKQVLSDQDALESINKTYPKFADQPFSYHFEEAIKGNKTSLAYVALYYLQDQKFDLAAQFSEKAAKQGEPIAMNTLGVMHLYGQHFSENIDQATEYFKQAIELGNGEAAYNLAALQADPITRFTLVAKAYKSGYLPANVPLAKTCLAFHNEKLAIELLEQAVEKNLPEAYGPLGQLMMESDPVKAITLLQKAKEFGDLTHAAALHQLQKKHAYLYQSCEQLEAKAQSMQPEDLYQYGMYLKIQGKTHFIAELLKAADNGHPQSCLEVAAEHLIQGDEGQWLHYTELAANSGIASAAYQIASYYKSEGLKSNPQKALDWATKAKNMGYPGIESVVEELKLMTDGLEYQKKYDEEGVLSSEEHNVLGRCFFEGKGMKKDINKAFTHFEQSAKMGSNEGIYYKTLISDKNNISDLYSATLINEHNKISGYKNALHITNDDENPFAPAALELATIYAKMAPEFIKDFFEPLENEGYFLGVASAYGDLGDDYRYGCWLLVNNEVEKGKKVLWDAAQKGHNESLKKLMQL